MTGHATDLHLAKAAHNNVNALTMAYVIRRQVNVIARLVLEEIFARNSVKLVFGEKVVVLSALVEVTTV